jgi:hypothetical protein
MVSCHSLTTPDYLTPLSCKGCSTTLAAICVSDWRSLGCTCYECKMTPEKSSESGWPGHTTEGHCVIFLSSMFKLQIICILGSHSSDFMSSVLWDVILCSSVEVNWHFEGIYCFHLHDQRTGQEMLACFTYFYILKMEAKCSFIVLVFI